MYVDGRANFVCDDQAENYIYYILVPIVIIMYNIDIGRSSKYAVLRIAVIYVHRYMI